MKTLVWFSLFVLSTIGGIAVAGCLATAYDCGTFVAADIPPGGTCNARSHDKSAVAISYDTNGDYFDTDTHFCLLGPC